MADDFLQLEGFAGNIKDSVSIIFCDNASSMWVPHEFINGEIVTRIFLYSEHSPGTRALLVTEPWSMILCMSGQAGVKNWSILASMCKHMIPSLLIVVAPDVTVPLAFMGHLSSETTMLVYRWISDLGNIGVPASTVFFPLQIQAGQIVIAQRSLWKGMPLRTGDINLPLIVQETRPQGLCLVSSIVEGGIVNVSWYRPRDSDILVAKERQDSLAMWLSVISDRVVSLLKK
jgi:hypothetical protein